MSSIKASSQSSSSRLAQVVLAFAFCIVASAAPAAGNAQGLPDFTELVEKVGPAVVNIRTLERGRQARGGSGDSEDDMAELLRRFFGQPPGQQRPMPRSQQPDSEPQQRGFASGFIVSADGYILTNAHVIDGAEEVIVTLADKREFKAKTIGIDKRSDVALVKIEATALPTVRIGDVAKLKVGEWVIAIGSPFGLESTVTAGIVSAKSRDTGDLLPLIQTDVAINPGNSGGPLINMRGEVVGINSQIYSRSGGFMGISFAIPIDEATRVSDQLRASGRVVRGRIGVVIDPVTREVAEAIGLGKAMGALVRSVESGGPADKAGVEPGDIITRVDSRSVDSSVELPRIVGNIKPGTKATLQVFRRGNSRDLAIVVAEFEPERVVARRAPDSPANPEAVTSIGLAVSDLTDAQKRDGKTKNGVRVDTVDGAAARAGIRENDLILTLDNVEVTGAKQFEGLLAKLDKSKPVTLLVRQGDTARYVIVRPGR
ncbi:MAG TPA: Do family serine endopeptidase [Caldimonas sp.]|nr:Do family serine endopeptidase [Caldimonas sp.]HEX4234931.1 Do family serine endopeptidase [Caldimonas sp.]